MEQAECWEPGLPEHVRGDVCVGSFLTTDKRLTKAAQGFLMAQGLLVQFIMAGKA